MGGGLAVEATGSGTVLTTPDGVWRTAMTQAMSVVRVDARDETCRQALRVSENGGRVRLRLSNALSPTPLHLASVTVGRRARGAAVQPSTLRPVTSGGSRAFTLAPGRDLVTDPVPLPVVAGSDLLVSFAVQGTARLSEHEQGAATGWCSGPGSGDRTAEPAATSFRPAGRHGLVVDGVSVDAGRGRRGTVVAIGDSLTDPRLRPDTYQRWTDVVTAQLRGAAPVANAAIDGNRVLLAGGYGPTMTQRLDRDVLSRDGVGTLLVLAGTNDGGSGATAPQVIDALDRLATRARARGIRVVLLTLLPAHRRAADREAVRQAVNAWIRTTDRVDLVLDAEAVLRDPQSPTRLRPEYDLGDGLHLSVAGHRALGRAVAAALR